jgi:hypothetical protein
MGAQALPPPMREGDPSGSGGQGPGVGGGFAAPAPAQPDQGAVQMLELVRTMVSAGRMIAQKVPAAVPEIRQINDLVARIQAKIVQGQQPTQPMAPPT